MKRNAYIDLSGLWYFLSLIIIVIIIIGALGGYIMRDCDSSTQTNAMKMEALEKGFAEYNSSNGKWQWKQIKEK